MKYNKLISKLGYNPKYFAQYLRLRKDLGISELSLEDILIDSETEMASFCLAPIEYERSFVNLYDDEIRDCISYLAFCRRYFLFPFSDEYAQAFRNCNSCAFSGVTNEGDLMCADIYVDSDYCCYEHTFDINYIPSNFGR